MNEEEKENKDVTAIATIGSANPGRSMFTDTIIVVRGFRSGNL
ncbi:hypothetical protein DsansV1_C33g0224441 [Dioscorea sansibarensis]